MGYTHKRKALINGTADQDLIFADPKELTVFPEDDGLQIADYLKGDFEPMIFRGKRSTY
jgi:hypothetical protein